MGKKRLYVSDEESARTLRASNPQEYAKQSYDALTNKPVYADLYEALDDNGKQELDNFFSQRQAINDMMEKEEEQLKYSSKNPIEEYIAQNQETLGVDYKSYKDAKSEYDKLEEKKYGWKQGKIYKENLEDNFKINDNDSWIKRNLKRAYNAIHNTVSAPVSFATAGIWEAFEDGYTPEEELRYNQLKKQIFEIERPVLEKQRQAIQTEYDTIKQKYNFKDGSFFQADSDVIALATTYQSALDEYDSAIEEGGIWNGLIQDRLGVVSIADNLKRTRIINKLRNEGESSLTDIEKDLLKAYDIQDRATTSNLNSNSNYGLGKTLRQSGEFVLESAIGTKIARGILSPLTNFTKVGSVGAKAISFGETSGAAAFMPSTYNQAMQKYNQQSQVIQDENGDLHYLASETQKFTEVNRLKNNLKEIDSEISNLERIDDPSIEETTKLNDLINKKNYITSNLSDLVDEKGKLKKRDVSALEAGAFGITQNIKENLAERYVGTAWDKYVPSLGSSLLNNKVGKTLVNSKLGKFVDRIDTKIATGLKRADDILFESNKFGKISKSLYSHVGPSKMIHSLPAEMIEEIAVQLTPTLGEDYAKQLNELAQPDFYTQVAAATLLMGGAYTTLGAASHYKQMTIDKEYRKNYNDFKTKEKILKNQYRDIDRAVNDDQLAQDIAMQTLGSIFQINEYRGRIAELRNPNGPNPDGLSQEERNKQADLLERNSFTNMALQSIQTGTDKELKKTLLKLSRNDNFSEETKKNALEGINKLNKYQTILSKNKDLLNRAKLTDIEIRKDLLESTLLTMEQERGELRIPFEEHLLEFNKLRDILDEENFSSFLVENSIENRLDENDQTFNNFIAEFLDTYNDKPLVTRFLELTKNIGELKFSEQQLNKELEYETNPINRTEIAKRELNAIKENYVDNVNKENVESVKENLKDQGLDDSKTISEVNEKAINDTKESDYVPKNKNKEIKSTIPVSEVKEAVGDNFDETPANEKIIYTDNDAIDADDLFEAPTETNLTPEQQAGVDAVNTGMYSPITYNTDNEEQNKFVDNLSKGFDKLLTNHPQMDFDGLIASLRSSYSGRSVEQKFNLTRVAWEKSTGNKLSEVEVKKVYNDNFADVTSVSEIVSAFGGTTPQSDIITVNSIKQSDKAGESDIKEYNTETNQEEVIEYAPHTQRKYAGVGLKLGGILGLNYEDTQTGKVTITNSVNETAKPFMDWRNFKVGDKIEFVFDIDYLLDTSNLLPIWENLNAEFKDNNDDRPIKRLVNTKNRLLELFKDNPELNSWDKIENALISYKADKNFNNPLFKNEEFLKIIPIGTVNKDYITDTKEDGTPADSILMGGLNDYYWFNNLNVALKTDKNTNKPLLVERELRIQKNREINLNARKSLLANKKLEVTISENRDVRNNTRILKTEEEINQGYTNEFFSLISQFANNIDEFNKNAAIAYMNASNNFIGSIDNSGDNIPVKIDNKSIKNNNIINYKDFIKNSKDSNFTNGRTIFLHKAGKNYLGEDMYLVHDVINNHKTKQDVFKNTREILDKLYFKLAPQNNDSQVQIKEKEILQKEFKKQFGYNFTKGVKAIFEDIYPKPHIKDGKKTGLFRQDFSAKAQAPGLFENIPDLSRFNNVDEFLNKLKNGEEIPSINKKEYLLSNIHTNLVFTPIIKNNETIYSHYSQPFMMFDFDNQETVNNIDINNENIKRLELRKDSLNKQIETTSNVEEKKQIERELKLVSKELLKENVQKAFEETVQDNTMSVISTDGIEYKVSSNDIIIQQTEVGPIRYIWDSDRNLIMLKSDSIKVNFDDNSKFDIVEELIGRTFSNIDISQNISVQEIYNIAEKEYNSIINELKNLNKIDEISYMQEYRDEILGIGIYEDSIREYINSLLDITEIEEVLDQTGENIKEYGQSSYEVDITKSLSFKVKLLLSGIKDNRIEKGFADFDGNMSLPNALDSLHQILSEVNNNSIEDVKNVIEEKIKKNPDELSFYNQILNRLNTIEKINPEILNEIFYNLYQPKVQMRFVMWKSNKNGYMTLENFDANVKNPLFIKRSMWNEALKKNGLIDLYEENFYKINENSFKKVEELYNNIFTNYNENKDINSVNRNDLKNYLKYFGITLNSKTIDNIYNQKSQNDLDIGVKLLDGKNSITNILFDNLKIAKEETSKKLTFNNLNSNEGIRRLNILTNRNSQINDLIHADNFIEFIPMNTMYIAGKTINMYQQPNSITNKIKDLKESLNTYISNLNNNDITENEKLSGVLLDYKNTPITSNSFLLGLLERNPNKIAKYLDTFLISLESLKEAGAKSRDDMSVTDLSDKDDLVTLLGMFASSEGEFTDLQIDAKYDKKIKLRKGAINFPTISDSSQLPFLKTILIELTEENIDLVNSQADESILSILREQLLVSDLVRIADYITNIGNDTSNVDGYDAGAIWITGLPSLNTVQVDYSYEVGGEDIQTKRPLVHMFRDYIANNPDNNNIDGISNFVNTYIEEINTEINNNIKYEVDKFVTSDLKSGQFVDFELLDKDKLKFNDSKEKGYFSRKPARLIAYDYVINNLLQQKEIQTIFAGDIAQYFKNKMESGLKHGLPKVKFEDVINFYYNSPENLDRISEITGNKNVENLLDEQKAQLIVEFPELAFTDELISSDINYEEAYTRLLPVVSYKVSSMFKDVQNNLSKRLKGQISPGSQLTDTRNLPPYIQVMVADIENSSETIEDMIQRNYPEKYKELIPKLKEFKVLDNLYNRTTEQEKSYKKLLNELNKDIPKISAYLKTASTDAQEYTSWRENLNQLKSQGRITESEYSRIESKLLAQTEDLKEGNIQDKNKLTEDEMKLAVMQPTKPLYSGMIHQNINNSGHNMQRYVYIKSSSFPLLPELTQMFPKLDNLRKTIDKIEDKEGTTVRVSYQSANKVGAVKNAVSISELYNENPDIDKILSSSLRLDRNNFYIQQDKPFKSDKNADKGKPDRVTRATQFEKIILGDGINKLGYEFPSDLFDISLLEELGIEPKDNKLNGSDLKNIYNNLYKKEQKILSDKLFNKLGINTYSDIKEGKPNVMENLAKLLNKRLSNKQDKKALELLYKVKVDGTVKIMSKQELIENDLVPYKAIFKLPLFMTPNSRKFESVLNSIVNKNNINLEMPGFSFPVASQEGFDYKKYSEETYNNFKSKGLIISPNFDPSVGLKSTRDSSTGKLKYAQVFLANKYKTFNINTGKYEYLDLTQYVNENNIIDTSKLPEDLLSMFSFRIPTSSHQSGTVIEVAGFLPHNVGDLMIVPKDHTVQIGEDYDIDVRYAYQYNYIKDSQGNIKKLEYSDINKPEKTLKEHKEIFENSKNNLWNQYYKEESNIDINQPLNPKNIKVRLKNPFLRQNKEKVMEILFLQDALDNFEVNKLVHAIFEEQYEIDDISKEFLKEKIAELETELIPRNVVQTKGKELKNEYQELKNLLLKEYNSGKSDLKEAWNRYVYAFNQNSNELKVLENNLVAMYKSVFSSTNSDVQNLITKVLSTDFSEESASEIDNRLSIQEPYYNIYSPTVQRKVMKLGADGKMGIGVHSNAVTMNSLLQQLDTPLQFINYWNEDTNTNVSYDIVLGNNTFNGVLGKISDGKRRLSEYLMESQNSATDNQKLEIMGRRNENAETISVFSLLQMTAMEDDGIKVNNQEISYASLFISQPIILDYVDTIKKYKSSTNKSYGNPETLTEDDIREKYMKLVPEKYWAINKEGKIQRGVFNLLEEQKIAKNLNSKFLFDQLRPLGDINGVDIASQYYILNSFLKLKKPARQLGELQSFINIENGGLGVSYFDVINLKEKISSINSLDITTVDKINVPLSEVTDKNSLFEEVFGNIVYVNSEENFKELEDSGFIFISESNGYKTYVQPNNHYSHKIMNSISLGYNLWNSLFPYDQVYIKQLTDTIINTTGINPNSKKALELKYDIISNMKDYSYTNSKVLFDGNVNKYQKEIFFDNKENNQESLGSYILRLKNDSNYNYIFNQPFFKDLQIEVNEKTYPTIIKYNTGDMSAINNLRMYNRLLKLINSEKSLPSKLNGKPMTEAELMKEILMYSLLADQGNGAIGFRQLLPIELFEKYNVDSMLRNRNEVDNYEMTNFIYNGPTKAAEAFMNNTTNEDGIIENIKNISIENIRSFVYQLNNFSKAETGEDNIYSVNKKGDILYNRYKGEMNHSAFVRQYFQHNPDKIAFPINFSENKDSKFQDLLKQNNISQQDFEDGKMTNFSIIKFNKPFMTIKGKDGSIQLFEKYDSITTDTVEQTTISYYKRIPILGVFGFNEYQTNKNINKSKVNSNNFNTSWNNTPINVNKTIEYLNSTELDTIIDNMINNYSGPYSALLESLKEFIPNINNVKVRTVSDLAGKAVYENENGQLYITINEKFLNNETTNSSVVQDALIEELLHHITVATIGDYVSFTEITPNGIKYEIVKDQNGIPVTIPAPLQTLLSVYNSAIRHYSNKYGVNNLLNQIEDFKSTISSKENSSILANKGLEEDAYRTMNIHEFIAGIFIKNTNFSNEMATTPYLQSGKSILAKFSDALARFFHRILPGARKNSISTNVASSLFEFLKTHHNTPNNKLVNIKKQKLPETSVIINEVSDLISELEEDTPGEENDQSPNNPIGMDDIFSPLTNNNVSLSNPITNVKLNC